MGCGSSRFPRLLNRRLGTVFQTNKVAPVGVISKNHGSCHACVLGLPPGDPVVEQEVENGLKTFLIMELNLMYCNM